MILTGNEGELDGKLIAALERLAQALRGELGRRARAHGLSPLQAQLLVYLHASRGRGEGRGVKGPAEAFGLAPGTVSEALSTLEAKGLVRKRPSAEDGRAIEVRLTPEGEALARELAGWVDPLREGLAGLPREPKAQALRVLLELIASLQRRGRIPYARMCLSCLYFERPSYCRLLKKPLKPEELRVDCPDHVPAASSR